MIFNLGDIVINNKTGNLFALIYMEWNDLTGLVYSAKCETDKKIILIPHEVLHADYTIQDEHIQSFSEHVAKLSPDFIEDKLLWLITGLIEENGELLQIVRNKEYKKLDIDINHVKEEMGDIFYYFTGILNHFGLTLKEIEDANITKLNKRFPSGKNSVEDAIKKVDHE